MPMYDDGSRAEQQELEMLKMWCRSAFIDAYMMGTGRSKEQAEKRFETWWKARDD